MKRFPEEFFCGPQGPASPSHNMYNMAVPSKEIQTHQQTHMALNPGQVHPAELENASADEGVQAAVSVQGLEYQKCPDVGKL